VEIDTAGEVVDGLAARGQDVRRETYGLGVSQAIVAEEEGGLVAVVAAAWWWRGGGGPGAAGVLRPAQGRGACCARAAGLRRGSWEGRLADGAGRALGARRPQAAGPRCNSAHCCCSAFPAEGLAAARDAAGAGGLRRQAAPAAQRGRRPPSSRRCSRTHAQRRRRCLPVLEGALSCLWLAVRGMGLRTGRGLGPRKQASTSNLQVPPRRPGGRESSPAERPRSPRQQRRGRVEPSFQASAS
jgi:hypothetical protein